MLSQDSVIDGKIYRSVHYIIKYKGIYLENEIKSMDTLKGQESSASEIAKNGAAFKAGQLVQEK